MRSNQDRYPDEQPTYHRRLRDEGGYHVMGCGKMHVGAQRFSTGADDAWDRDGTGQLDRWGYSDGLFNAGKNQAAVLADRHGEPRDAYATYLAEQGWLDAHVEDYRRRNRLGPDGEFTYPEEPIWTATFPTPLPDEHYFDTWIARNGLSLLDDAPADEPWFLQVNFQNPHHPWDVTEEMREWYAGVEFPDPVNCDLEVEPEEHAEIRRNYAAMIEHLDRRVGEFVTKLEERGELEETLIVFASDHGEMLGDHGQWSKLSPLHPSVGVPLIVAGPGVESRSACDHPATILDLHATFLDYAGVEPGDDVDSRSMRAFLAGERERHRHVVRSALGPWRLAFDGRYKYVEGYDPEVRRGDEWDPQRVDERRARELRRERDPVLYDVRESEAENVAARRPDVVDRLSDEL